MSSLQEVGRFDDLSFGQWKALGTKCGGLENVIGILQGEQIVSVKCAPVQIVDKNGRIIPFRGLFKPVCDANQDYYLKQPEIDYADRLARFAKYLGEPSISAADFKVRIERLLRKIETKNDGLLRNLTRGVWLPLVFSPLAKNFLDYGQPMDKVFLPAAARAYEEQFCPARKLRYYQKRDLKGNIKIIRGTRHAQLVNRMKKAKISKDMVVGIYFPNAMQGFSIIASREQMKYLPEGLLLAGGFDTVSAMVMYPEVLLRDHHTPTLFMAALSWQSNKYSLYSDAGNAGMSFGQWDKIIDTDGSCSAGLLFLG